MYGMFSSDASTSRGSYYRRIALIGAVSVVVFGVVAKVLLPSDKEFWFDRALVCIAGLILAFAPRSLFKTKQTFIKWNYAFYFLYCAQGIFICTLNNFQLLHFLFLFVGLLCCSLSFRKGEEATVFMFITTGACIFCLSMLTSLPYNEKWMYAIFLLIIGGLNAYLSTTKCRFVGEIQVSRDLLRSMLNKTENGVFITDTSGYIFDCNGRAEEMFGFSRQEMLDHDFKMLRVHELNADEIQVGFMSLRKDNFWSSETLLKRKDGSHFMAYISIALLYKDGNQYLVYRVRDISKLKEHEQEIVTAKEAAEQAAKAKAQFLATMTHEIRTPLNGVIGMASVLQNTTLDTIQRDHVDTILKSGQSLMVLINDILDFSKMESGKAKLELAPTSIEECIYEVSDLLRPHAESKGIALSLDVSSKIPSAVMCDGGRMKQVLLNLIGNAIKFTQEGEVKVLAKMMSVSKSHTELQITIADSGIGIPEEKLSGLFNMFSQVDSSTSRKYGGTGLGLAISKQIVELLGGNISVRSVEGKGSSFTIDLKCELAKQGLAENVHRKDIGREEYCKLFAGVKILVAEDNVINQKVLCYMLEQVGLVPDLAGNGIEAVAMAEQHDYDLVFMDIQMPEMNGLDATTGIRALSKKQPTIVAMTANNSEQDRIDCRQRGMDAFISKPFVLDQIITCLTGFVQAKSTSSDGLHAA